MTKPEALFEQIKNLSAADRFRLVGQMLDGVAEIKAKDPSKARSILDMALSVSERTTMELRAAILLLEKR